MAADPRPATVRRILIKKRWAVAGLAVAAFVGTIAPASPGSAFEPHGLYDEVDRGRFCAPVRLERAHGDL